MSDEALSDLSEPQERRERAAQFARQIVHDNGDELTDPERQMLALGWRSGYLTCLRDIQRAEVPK